MTVVVHGPAGCGKTRNAEAIRQSQGCHNIVDGWQPDDHRARAIGAHSLVLTTAGADEIRQALPRARIIAFDTLTFRNVRGDR